jgi:hypothetical protein
MTYTYTTPALVKSELRATEDFASSTIPSLDDVNNWIAEASEEINLIAGKAFGQTSYSEIFDYRGDDVILLKNAPLISVTNVVESLGALGTDTYSLSDTKVEDKDYTVYKESGEIEVLHRWKPREGLKTIKVNYTAGYTTTPKVVQMLATKKVAKRTIDTLLSKDINQKQSGKSVGVGSIKIIKPADFGVSQFKILKEDIMEMEKKLLEGTSLYRLPMNRY